MLIPDHIIQQIKDYPPVQFIGMFVDLKRKANNYIGLCPFHDEKSASFDVSPAKGLYKCFGCDKTGRNPIDFIMDLENLSFIDAVKRCMTILNISNETHLHVPTTPMPKRIKEKIPVDYIPYKTIYRNIEVYKRNNLYFFLCAKYGLNHTTHLCKLYNVGSCVKHGEGTTLFIQKDINGNLRQAKAMMYNALTGKRNRAFDPIYLGKNILASVGRGYDKINLAQCFFGEHLLKGNNKPVAICESEKTSMISSLYHNNYIWLATGGKNGCRWYSKEVSKVLIGREVFLFPDVDALSEWTGKADELRANTGSKVTVIDIMNGQPPPPNYEKYDIADLLIDLGEPPPPITISLELNQIESFPTQFIYEDYLVQTVKTTVGEWYDILVTCKADPLVGTDIKDFLPGMFCGENALLKQIHNYKTN